jgi:hypothetical protein
VSTCRPSPRQFDGIRRNFGSRRPDPATGIAGFAICCYSAAALWEVGAIPPARAIGVEPDNGNLVAVRCGIKGYRVLTCESTVLRRRSW